MARWQPPAAPTHARWPKLRVFADTLLPCCSPGWGDEKAVREGAKTVRERKGRTVIVTRDHPPTASSVLQAAIKRTTFDSKGLFI